MLTGYNTDVSYGGVTYHVQTEDKGISNPVILSLVYQGGTILAAKRTHYGDLVQEGRVDEGELAKMLERQHRILVAALQAGKSERLIQLSRRQSEQCSAPQPPFVTTGEIAVVSQPPTAPAAAPTAQERDFKPEAAAANGNRTSRLRAPAPAPPTSLEQIISSYLPPVAPQERLRLELLTSAQFYAGEKAVVCVAVTFGGLRPVEDAAVRLQIVGTRISAQTLAARTDRRGLAEFHISIPSFTTGAAALILKAADRQGQETEAKFLIRRKATEP